MESGNRYVNVEMADIYSSKVPADALGLGAVVKRAEQLAASQLLSGAHLRHMLSLTIVMFRSPCE